MHAPLPKIGIFLRWQRFVRGLIYGRDVDRHIKARARIGLAILVFACIYAVIAGRLVLFAMAPEGHNGRRGSSQDAVATARPAVIANPVAGRRARNSGALRPSDSGSTAHPPQPVRRRRAPPPGSTGRSR